MSEINITLKDVYEITLAALKGAGANQNNAASVARSTVLAERDGTRSHGLMYVPIYAEHIICGKVVQSVSMQNQVLRTLQLMQAGMLLQRQLEQTESLQ
jgi:LDH2 family malate/lactate/ureidoglycolate dehydrogenase